MATVLYRLELGIPPEQALAGIRRKIGGMVPYVVQFESEEPLVFVDYTTAQLLRQAGFEVEKAR